MTTSGITALALTARDFVTGALQDNAIIPIGETPTAAEMAICIRRLNLMLQSWSIKANLWREETATFVIPAGTGTVALPGVQDVVGIRHAVTASYARPLFGWTREQFKRLPNGSQVGNPSSFYAERDRDGLTLKVWPVPSASINVAVDYIRLPEVITDEDQTVDFRQEFGEAIQTNLALRCCPVFEKQPHPELAMRAQRLETEMLDYDRPASYFMETDCSCA